MILDRATEEQYNEFTKSCFNSLELGYADGDWEGTIVKLILKNHPNKNFIKAVLSNDVDKVKRIFDNSTKEEIGSNLSRLQSYPFVFSCFNGHLEMVRLLIDRCPPSVQEDMFSTTPINPFQYAAENGHLEVVRLMLDKCPKKTFESMFIIDTFDPFIDSCAAGRLEVVALLIEKCPSNLFYNMITANYYPAFLVAAEKGQFEVLRLLIHTLKWEDNFFDADNLRQMYRSNEDGQGDYQVFKSAIKSGNLNVIKLLIDECPKDLLDEVFENIDFKCLRSAFNSGHFVALEFLLSFIHEKYTEEKSNPSVLNSAVSTLHGTIYGDMEYVQQITEERKKISVSHPESNVDEFNQNIFELTHNSSANKLLISCKNLSRGITGSALQCEDVFYEVLNFILCKNTDGIEVKTIVPTFRQLILSDQFDLNRDSPEFLFQTRATHFSL